MSIKTNTFILFLRKFIRKVGLNKPIAKIILSGKNYEEDFNNAFVAYIKKGDCIWDVGAYIGFYAKQFAEKVGPSGVVYAIEPSPINFGHLSENIKQLANVKAIRCALGNTNRRALLIQERNSPTTSHISYENDPAGEPVDIFTADSLIEQGICRIPNALKIDCEGFELEILEGMRNLLNNPALRLIGIETHFGILEKRGLKEAPKQIEEKLLNCGFHITWPDWSHIIDIRSLKQ